MLSLTDVQDIVFFFSFEWRVIRSGGPVRPAARRSLAPGCPEAFARSQGRASEPNNSIMESKPLAAPVMYGRDFSQAAVNRIDAKVPRLGARAFFRCRAREEGFFGALRAALSRPAGAGCGRHGSSGALTRSGSRWEDPFQQATRRHVLSFIQRGRGLSEVRPGRAYHGQRDSFASRRASPRRWPLSAAGTFFQMWEPSQLAAHARQVRERLLRLRSVGDSPTERGTRNDDGFRRRKGAGGGLGPSHSRPSPGSVGNKLGARAPGRQTSTAPSGRRVHAGQFSIPARTASRRSRSACHRLPGSRWSMKSGGRLAPQSKASFFPETRPGRRTACRWRRARHRCVVDAAGRGRARLLLFRAGRRAARPCAGAIFMASTGPTAAEIVNASRWAILARIIGFLGEEASGRPRWRG